ncbi:MAG: hypothetical protein KDI22_02080 [Gammaproteobacteria bacterium]|nr:hypothetical protein [Gammaproteobacteria bacterium]MCP5317388.1 hypothetical protein [Chromatiaceae bacterium]MCP5435899.1 hypothetical protein [Chromatiaceae bacterium]
MITHFDMITGQPLNNVQEADQADIATPDVVAPSLRLLTVQESIGAGHAAASFRWPSPDCRSAVCWTNGSERLARPSNR